MAEEVAGIIAEASAKEAQAFEREVDKIRGKMQTLDDKIFAQEHSQYETDVRKLQQEFIELYKEGLPIEKIQRYYQNAMAELQARASKDKDYRKSPNVQPTRAVQSGAAIIGGDQIVSDGTTKVIDESLQERREEIGLLADENQIRQQLLQQYSAEGRTLPTLQQQLSPDLQQYFSSQPQGNYQLPEFQLPETSISFETVVKPLDNIEVIMGNILSALNNRGATSMTVSPNISINLGGAYVFDDAMKTRLANDITDEVVTGIQEAVQIGTNRRNYGFGC